MGKGFVGCMADEIKGVAILHTVLWDTVPREMLMICCVGDPAVRKTHFGMIPVRPEGTAESVNPGSWQYRVAGETIHVSPSVKLTKRRPAETGWQDVEVFHNGGTWSVRFLRFEDLPAAEKEEGAYGLWRRLNAEWLVNEHEW